MNAERVARIDAAAEVLKQAWTTWYDEPVGGVWHLAKKMLDAADRAADPWVEPGSHD